MGGDEFTLKLSVRGRASGTFKVRKDVDLAQVKPGVKVFIRIASAAAIMLEKPCQKRRLNPNSEVGRDGALRRHRAVQARNCVVHDNPICTISSDR
jgi:hypothetical protein